MSSYLVIKKDNATLGEWSRSTKLYQAFERAPYGEEREFSPEEEFPLALDNLKYDIKEYKDSKDTYKKVLIGLNSVEDRFDTIDSIKELDVEIAECEVAMHDIYFMQNCYEYGKYNDEEENIWTWSVE